MIHSKICLKILNTRSPASAASVRGERRSLKICQAKPWCGVRSILLSVTHKQPSLGPYTRQQPPQGRPLCKYRAQR